MTWFRVDDGLHSHPKVLDLPLDALGLWVLCGSYCADHLTDGFVPVAIVRRLGGDKAMTDALVAAGLWITGTHGWQFHDWNGYQETKDTVVQKREKWARDKKRQRGYRTQLIDSMSTVDSAKDSTVESAESPGIGIGIGTGLEPRKKESRFDDFWAVYPRRDDKIRARKAWDKALREATADEIIAGAIRYRDDPNREQEFTKQPATWLNAGAWSNDPLPVRGSGTSKSQQRSDEALDLIRRAAERDAVRETAQIRLETGS